MIASVAAGTTLSAAGAVTVKMMHRRAELSLALIPLLFGVQQLTEGMVWWSLDHNAATVNAVSTFAYTLFSHVLWPIFVPLTILRMESVPWRRRVLTAFLAAGTAVGLYLLYSLIRGPITSHVVGSSIQYKMPNPYIIALYLLATCTGAMFSSRRFLRVMGVAALGLALLTLWLYAAVFVSVWCFFSAILSLMIAIHCWSVRTRNSIAVV